MPYYGVPIDVTYDGVKYDQIGMAFSRQIVTDLLRGKLGFKGYVNSDTGVINSRAWGLESTSVPERVATAINGGTDMLSGFSVNETITDLVRSPVSDARVTRRQTDSEGTVLARSLREPLCRSCHRDEHVGRDQFRARGLDVQRKSIVLLQNQDQAGGKTLPLKAGARIYIMGDLTRANVETYGFTVTDGNHAAGQGRPSAASHDYAVISVTALNRAARSLRLQEQRCRDGSKPRVRQSHHRRPTVQTISPGSTMGCRSVARFRGKPVRCRSRRWLRRSPGRSRLR